MNTFFSNMGDPVYIVGAVGATATILGILLLITVHLREGFRHIQAARTLEDASADRERRYAGDSWADGLQDLDWSQS